MPPDGTPKYRRPGVRGHGPRTYHEVPVLPVGPFVLLRQGPPERIGGIHGQRLPLPELCGDGDPRERRTGTSGRRPVRAPTPAPRLTDAPPFASPHPPRGLDVTPDAS